MRKGTEIPMRTHCGFSHFVLAVCKVLALQPGESTTWWKESETRKVYSVYCHLLCSSPTFLSYLVLNSCNCCPCFARKKNFTLATFIIMTSFDQQTSPEYESPDLHCCIKMNYFKTGCKKLNFSCLFSVRKV